MRITQNMLSLAILVALCPIMANAQRLRLDRTNRVETQPRAEVTPVASPNNTNAAKPVAPAGPAPGDANYLVKFDAEGNPTANSVALDDGLGLKVRGEVNVDNADSNDGTTSGGVLRFGGSGSGEVIASRRKGDGNQYGLDFFTDSKTRLSITNAGNLGIGTRTPESLVHIGGLFGSLEFEEARPGGTPSGRNTPTNPLERVATQKAEFIFPFKGLMIDQVYTKTRSTTGFTFLVRSIHRFKLPTGRGDTGIRTDFLITGGGKVGVGTDKPDAQLHIENPGGVANIRLAGSELTDNYDGVLHIRSGGDRVEFDGNDTVVVDVLQIKGGADLSENFDVKVNSSGNRSAGASPLAVESGMVVSIDPENPGKLVVSSRAYDRRVAGIISGAGGVKPGMTMGQANSLADGSRPVALSGRVYCLVDASYGPVAPGDLLTSSDTPGYAMKVSDPSKAQGTIIGKAMTRLANGRGLVLVLVALQ